VAEIPQLQLKRSGFGSTDKRGEVVIPDALPFGQVYHGIGKTRRRIESRKNPICELYCSLKIYSVVGGEMIGREKATKNPYSCLNSMCSEEGKRTSSPQMC
jgi:hypothetical protein